MSSIVRQENLFAAEDFTKIYRSFQDVSFKSYDFNELKATLIDYIRVHFPEDFNDYVESSEFVAIIELLAFLGTSLAFRIDLNSRENILDTAQRRESIIRLARMINYRPKRNIAATGLFKLTTIQTNQPITDSVGKSLNGVPVTWADPNNPDWFDQFITILNAVFRPVNPFGHASKSAIVGGVPTDLYELNNLLGMEVVHSITATVNGEDISIDIVNPDIDVSIEERHPDQDEPFNLIYRNDSQGITSSGTGFFLKFKQGSLKKEDFDFEFPEVSRTQSISATNVNETDVYVQEINDDGSVNEKWEKVPAVAGNNIIFNSIAHNIRNIFEIIPGNNNAISIKFADGNFGNIPTGLIRVWYRVSVNRTVVIRPEDIQGKSISFSYAGPNNDVFTFNVSFSLESVVANGAPTETNEEIKIRAPQVFYTQQRMINNEDYNVLPLVFGNQILKVRAINRTHAGHSRFIDINDPTGFHQNLILYGDDGAIYREDFLREEIHVVSELPNTLTPEIALLDRFATFLPAPRLRNFYFAFYISEAEKQAPPSIDGVYPPPSGFPSKLNFLDAPLSPAVTWKTAPDTFKNDTGYFKFVNGDPRTLDTGVWDFIKDGAVITLSDGTNEITTSVTSVIRVGFPKDPSITKVGPVELGAEVADGWQVTKVLPAFRTTFTPKEEDLITAAFINGGSFGLGYDLRDDQWYVIDNFIENDINLAFDLVELVPTENIDREVKDSWLIAAIQTTVSGEVTYRFISRGSTYIFESLRTVRFYFDAEQRDLDLNTGRAREDTIEILPTINLDKNSVPLTKSIIWKVENAIIQNDGFRDPNKVEVIPADLNEDNVADDPTSFERLVTKWQPIFPAQATGTVTVNTGEVESVTITFAGKGYFIIPEITFSGDGTGATGTAVLDGTGGIASVTIDAVGSGYSAATIEITVGDQITDWAGDEVVFRKAVDIDGYEKTRLWVVDWISEMAAVPFILLDISDTADKEVSEMGFKIVTNLGKSDPAEWEFTFFPLASGELFEVLSQDILDSIIPLGIGGQAQGVGLVTQLTTNLDPLASSSILIANTKKFLLELIKKTFLINDQPIGSSGRFRAINDRTTPTGREAFSIVDIFHVSKVGRVFDQVSGQPIIERTKFHFKWSHVAPADHRIDPSVSNIVDITVLNNTYFTEVLIWKDDGGNRSSFPVPPTTAELRVEYAELDNFKSISDQIIYSPGIFKLLFGRQADEELQAKFVAVKIPSATISDSELKTKIIQAIDKYFDISNWDFGERFFFTELAAFIHANLSKFLGSVVLVPRKGESKFGTLFEITSGPSELFLSTATVADVEIVTNFTGTQLKI